MDLRQGDNVSIVQHYCIVHSLTYMHTVDGCTLQGR